MKTIFAISHGEYSDYTVDAVCEDEKTAQAWVEAMNADEERSHQPCAVEEIRFIEKGEAPVKLTTFNKSATLWDNGEVEDEQEWSYSDWKISAIYGPPPRRPHVRYIRAPIHNKKGGRLEVRGNSARSVAKVFGEKLAMWRAGSWGGPKHREINEP